MIHLRSSLLSITLLYVSIQATVLVVEQGVERPTSWYFLLETSDSMTCAQECFKATSCQSWNWDQSSKDCFLNKADAETRSRKGWFSGVVGTDDLSKILPNSNELFNINRIESFSINDIFGSNQSKFHKVFRLTPHRIPVVIGPPIGMTTILKLDKTLPFTLTTWVWLWDITPSNQHHEKFQHSVLFSTRRLSDSPDSETELNLAPTILLNVGSETSRQGQFYFATQSSGTLKSLEYHGHFSGVTAPFAQWTHLGLTYDPKVGTTAFVNGQQVIQEKSLKWGDNGDSVGPVLAGVGGGLASQRGSTPQGLVSDTKFLSGRALPHLAVIKEMEDTRPQPPPPPLLRHVAAQPFTPPLVDMSIGFGKTHTNAALGVGILLAQYKPVGAVGDQGKDVTAELRHLVRSTKMGAPLMRASTTQFNQVLGDPYPNIRKELYIQWTLGPGSGVVEGVWAEGQKLDLFGRHYCFSAQAKARFVPYFLHASWSGWSEDSQLTEIQPLVNARISSNELVENALSLAVGPMAQFMNESLKPRSYSSAVLKAVERHYSHVLMDGNTTTLLMHNTRLQHGWRPVMKLAASTSGSCARACHAYQPSLLEEYSVCDGWEWIADDLDCRLLTRQSRKGTTDGPLHVLAVGWTSGLRPGVHQPNYAVSSNWRQELATWTYRLALICGNDRPTSKKDTNNPSKEAAAMALAFRTMLAHSEYAQDVEETKEFGDINQSTLLNSPVDISLMLVNQIVGEEGRKRRVAAEHMELARPLFEKLEAFFQMATHMNVQEDEEDEPRRPLNSPPPSTRQEVRMDIGEEDDLELGNRDLMNELAATYYATSASWVASHWGSTNYSPMGTPEAPFLSQPEPSATQGSGMAGEDLFQFQEMRANGDGDAEAQLWLGRQYYWGRGGVARDRQAAAGFFRAAAQGGAVEAMYDFGIMLLNGDGVPRNPVEAVRYFREAANAGLNAAHNGLGALYLNPQLLIAATEGSPGDREFILSEFGDKINQTAALYHFQQAGNSDSMYSLGNLYRQGWTLDGLDLSPRRYERALESFARSASMGHPRSLTALGSALLDHDSWLAVGGRERETLGLSKFVVEIKLPQSPRSTGESGLVVELPMYHSAKAALQILRILSEMGPWSNFHLAEGAKSYKLVAQSSSDEEGLTHLGTAAWYFGVGAELGLTVAGCNDAWLHQWPHLDQGLSRVEEVTNFVVSKVSPRYRKPLPIPTLPQHSRSHIIRRLTQLAADGDAHAVRKLGDKALNGQHHMLAVRYYEAATDLGDSESLFNLARLAHENLQPLGVLNMKPDRSIMPDLNHTALTSSLRGLYMRCLNLGGDSFWPGRLGLLQLEVEESLQGIAAFTNRLIEMIT